MNLCSEGHEEVCFEGRDCPVCEAIETADSLQSDLDSLLEDYSLLEEVNVSLNERIEDLEHTIESRKDG